METPKIQAIINKFRNEHPKYTLYKDEAILQLIFETEPDKLEGISQSEIDKLKKQSIFGAEFNNYQPETGITFEYTAKNNKPKYTSKDIQKAKDAVNQKYVGDNVYKNTFQALKFLGFDITSDDGIKVMNRIMSLPENFYNEENIGSILIDIITENNLEPTFENIADSFEAIGITIRNSEEAETNKEHIQKLKERLYIQNLLASMYSNYSEMYDSAGANLTPVDIMFYADNLNKLTTKITGKPHDFKSLSKRGKQWSEKFCNMNVFNENEFKKQFKQYFGIDYNEKLVKENMECLQDPNNENFDRVIKEFLGFNLLKNARTSLTAANLTAGAADLYIMFQTLGLANSTKGVKTLKNIAMLANAGRAEKIAIKGTTKFSKLMHRFAGKCVSLGGNALIGGYELGGFELAKGTLGNVLTADNTQELINNELQVFDNAKQSFGFGFFGGIWGQTAVSTVQRAVSRTSARTASALSPKFAKGSVKLSEVVSTFVEKSVPTTTAKLAGFLTEIIGFAGYETAIEAVKKIPADEITFEKVTTVLWEQLQNQGIGLTQVKLISRLVMWSMGGKAAQMASMDFLKSKEFDGINVREVKGNGKAKYVVEGNKFKLECKSLDEVITSGIFIARLDKSFEDIIKENADKINDEESSKTGNNYTPPKTEIVEIQVKQDIMCSDKTYKPISPITKETFQMTTEEKLARYKELLEAKHSGNPEYDKYARDVLSLQFSLALECGYYEGVDGELDLDFDPNSKTVPNSDILIEDLITQLKQRGFNHTAIESIRNHINRVNLDILNMIPSELIQSEWAGILCLGVKPENIQKRIEVIETLKGADISTENKIKLICWDEKFDIKQITKAVTDYQEAIKYIEESGIDKEYYDKQTIEDRMLQDCGVEVFNKEIFDAVKDTNPELIQDAFVSKFLSKEETETNVKFYQFYSDFCNHIKNPEIKQKIFDFLVKYKDNETLYLFKLDSAIFNNLYHGDINSEDVAGKKRVFSALNKLELSQDEKLAILSYVNSFNVEYLSDLADKIPTEIKDGKIETSKSYNELMNFITRQREILDKIEDFDETILTIMEQSANMEEMETKYAYLSKIKVGSYNLATIKVYKNLKNKKQLDIVEKFNLYDIPDYHEYDIHHIFKNSDENYDLIMALNIQGEIKNFKPFAHLKEYIKKPEDLKRFEVLISDKNAENVKELITDENYAIYKAISSSDGYSKGPEHDASEDVEIAKLELSKAKNPDKSKICTYKYVEEHRKEYKLAKALKKYNNSKNESLSEKTKFENPEVARKRLQYKTSGVDFSRFDKYPEGTIDIICEILYNNGNIQYTKEEYGQLINKYDFSKLTKRIQIINCFKPEIQFRLTFCDDAEFDKIVSVIEKRPEVIKIDKASVFDKAINMTDAEFRRFITPIKDRTPIPFDAKAYSKSIDEMLAEPYEQDMSAFEIDKRQHPSSTTSQYTAKKYIKVTSDMKSVPKLAKAEKIPSTEDFMQQLKATGKVTVELKDFGGVKPNRTDVPGIVVKGSRDDRKILGVEEEITIDGNIADARNWDSDKLTRDIMQNQHFGNGETLEGVTIDIQRNPNGKYKVIVSGKGMFDYDDVTIMGSSGQRNNHRSGGKNGEGTKVIAFTLLKHYNSPEVKYKSGNWEVTYKLAKEVDEIENSEPIIRVINEPKETLLGNSLEFETDDLTMIESLINSTKYFYSPYNGDWAGATIENDYMSVKFHKGKKGNFYLIQKYGVDGNPSLDGTLDGLTLIFKTDYKDPAVVNKGEKIDDSKFEGRDRLSLSYKEIGQLVNKFAYTLTEEQLALAISEMEDAFKNYKDDACLNVYILKGLLETARMRDINIDFDNKYLTIGDNEDDAKEVRNMGKIPVMYDMWKVGVMSKYDYEHTSHKERIPLSSLSSAETRKIRILDEAVKLFSEYLDLENSGMITEQEAKSPKYVFDPKNADITIGGEAIVDMSKDKYFGHWVNSEVLDNQPFASLLATWLHETSHKTGGDGSVPFNKRLIDLEQKIVEISLKDPTFCEKLSILSDKFYGISDDSYDIFDEESEVKSIEAQISELLKGISEPQKPDEEISSTQQHNEYNDMDVSNLSKTFKKSVITRIKNFINRKLNLFRRPKRRVDTGEILFDRQPVRETEPIPQKAEPQAIKTESVTKPVEEQSIEEKQIKKQTGNFDFVGFTPKPKQTQEPTNYAELCKNELSENGELHYTVPKLGETSPTKHKLEGIIQRHRHLIDNIKPYDAKICYNSNNPWSYEMLARDILQNFCDGNGNTLDGIKIDIVKTGEEYSVRISGDSEYDYHLGLKMYAGTKTNSSTNNGNYGEGGKVVPMALLYNDAVDKYTIGSSYWSIDFTAEEGLPKDEARLMYTLHEHKNEIKGSFVEFKTSNTDLINAILEAQNYFKSSTNPDFVNSKTFDGKTIAFDVHKGKPGNFYLSQRQMVKESNRSSMGLEKPLEDITIIFKRKLTEDEKYNVALKVLRENEINIYGLSREEIIKKYEDEGVDRQGLKNSQIFHIAYELSAEMTNEELAKSIVELIPFGEHNATNISPTILTSDGISTMQSPAQALLAALVKRACERGVKFNDDAKVAYIKSWRGSTTNYFYPEHYYEDQGKALAKQGYKIVRIPEFEKLGFKDVQNVYKNFNSAELSAHSVTETSMNVVEQQKIKLLEHIIPAENENSYSIIKPQIRITENTIIPELPVKFVETSDGDYIEINRKYFESADFATIYTQIRTQFMKNEKIKTEFHNRGRTDMDWGYKMTDLIYTQIRTALNPADMLKFKMVESIYNSLGKESNK